MTGKNNSDLRFKLGKLASYAIILNLVYAPIAMSANTSATQVKNNYSTAPSTGQNAGNAAINLLGQGLQMYQQTQIQLQQQAQAYYQRMMLEKTLTPVKFQDDLFSMCTLSPAQMSHIEGMCSAAPTSEVEAQTIQMYMNKCRQNANDYDLLSKEGLKEGQLVLSNGQVLSTSEGYQCVKEQSEQLRKQLTDNELQVQAMMAQVKNDSKTFQSAADKRLNAIKDLQDELNGTSTGTLSAKQRDWTSSFGDASCKSVLNSDQLKGQKGLRGIQKDVSTVGYDRAQTLISSEKSINSEIQVNLSKVSSYITKNRNLDGLEKSAGYSALSSKYGAVGTILSEELETYKTNLNEIKASIPQSLGSQIPTDETALTRFIANAPSKLKNDYMVGCMKTQASMDLTEMIGRLEDRENDNRGSRLKFFQSDLLKLESLLKAGQITLDEFTSRVKAKDAEYGSAMSIRLTVPYGGRPAGHWTITDLTAQVKSDCVAVYSNGKSALDETLTNKQADENAVIKLKEYQNLNKKLASSLSNAVFDKVLYCKNVSYTASPEFCNSNKLNTSSPDFCLSQSVQCAKAVSGCYAKADAIIKTKEANMKTVATAHNTAVAAYKKKQDTYLKSVAAQFAKRAQLLKAKYPNVNYTLPMDLAVKESTPKLIDGYEVALSDTKDYTADLEKNLDGVLTKVKEQNKNVESSIKEHMTLITKRYGSESQYWKGQVDACQNQLNAYNDMNQQAYKQQQDQYQEGQKSLSELCSAINYGPDGTPICGSAAQDLGSTSSKVAYMLNQSDRAAIVSYENYCAKYSEGSDNYSYSEATLFQVLDYCDKHAADAQCVAFNKDLKDQADGSKLDPPKCAGEPVAAEHGTGAKKCFDKQDYFDKELKFSYRGLVKAARTNDSSVADAPSNLGEMRVSACLGQSSMGRGGYGKTGLDAILQGISDIALPGTTTGLGQ